MTKALRTNALRLLERAGVVYQLATYEYDEDHLDALHAAEAMGVEPCRVFKTLCFLIDGRSSDFALVCVPSSSRVAPKKVAQALGAKSAELAPLAQLKSLTGYERGGCSPLGVARRHRFLLDKSAMMHQTIGVSAGARGAQVWLAPNDLLSCAKGTVAEVTYDD